MAQSPLPPGAPTVICDFDGTITTRDIGEALCARFAPGALARVDALWHAGRLTFREAHRAAFREVRAPLDDLVRHALEVGVVREGFTELAQACADVGAELVVASAGLDFYIAPILERHLGDPASWLRLHANVGRWTPLGVEIDFPHPDPACDECGSCKAAPARAARARGRTVIAVGDSFSDRCLAAEADHVFARAWLAEHCRAARVHHEPFDDLHGVARLVRELAVTAPDAGSGDLPRASK